MAACRLGRGKGFKIMKKVKKLRVYCDKPIVQENLTMVIWPHILAVYEDGKEVEIGGTQLHYPIGAYPKPEEIRENVFKQLKSLKAQVGAWNEYDTIVGEENGIEEEME